MPRIDDKGNIVRDDVEQGRSRDDGYRPATSATLSSTPAGPWYVPRSLHSSPATYTLLVLQLIMYLVSSIAVAPRGWYYPTTLALLRVGSDSGEYISCAVCGYVLELRRLVVPIFLHLSILHIAFNFFFQFTSCPILENMLGTKPFVILFVGAGVCGNLLGAAVGENGVGASTACYGILGASYMIEYINWPTYDQATRESRSKFLVFQTIFLLFWEVMMWDTVGHFGHLGGLIGGALILSQVRPPSGEREERTRKYTAIVLLMFIAACGGYLWIPRLTHFPSSRSYCSVIMNIY